MTDPTPSTVRREQISALLEAWTARDPAARDALMPVVFDELHRLAHRYMRRERSGHTLQTTALVNEAYLRLIDIDRMEWRDRTHFFAMAATMMRRILVDYARAQARGKRGGGIELTSVDADLPAPRSAVDLMVLDDALTRLAALDPALAHIVELRFFSGLTIDETAEALGISTGTVKRDWNMAKAWLYEDLKS